MSAVPARTARWNVSCFWVIAVPVFCRSCPPSPGECFLLLGHCRSGFWPWLARPARWNVSCFWVIAVPVFGRSCPPSSGWCGVLFLEGVEGLRLTRDRGSNSVDVPKARDFNNPTPSEARCGVEGSICLSQRVGDTQLQPSF